MQHSNASTRTPDPHELDIEFERLSLSSTVGSLSTFTSDTYDACSRSLPDLSRMTPSNQDVWALNKSSRTGDTEKLFVTFTEQYGCGHWLVITCQYRNVEPNSFEEQLMALPSAQARSAKIYANLHHLLPDIEFFEHVTHLNLQTIEGQVYVITGPGTEDCCVRSDTTQNTASGYTCPGVIILSAPCGRHVQEQEQKDENAERAANFERKPTVVAELDGGMNEGGKIHAW
ncbi:hypothetical protein LTR96_011358 [Exophiala xenobiotica]|nr:hypothetical protein LTR41_011376 [Exophiala xenobiotica]KAK5221584.1 hypothetical protein LTR47_010824 [Exophiala xenobiotica]KAK5247803.1 hypothetical protein LTS06_007106 [Exophiala xenobiotica]KAK5262077.1 hypothetical protein LTR40_001007 [Exophiala xenobiotica]KAK5263218.1 hypothetical protein LTR96_011358 [Exophiala xenobiotica]